MMLLVLWFSFRWSWEGWGAEPCDTCGSLLTRGIPWLCAYAHTHMHAPQETHLVCTSLHQQHVLPLWLMFQTWLNTTAWGWPGSPCRTKAKHNIEVVMPLPSSLFWRTKGNLQRKIWRDLPKSVQPHLRFSLDIKLHPVSSHGLISYHSYICRFG